MSSYLLSQSYTVRPAPSGEVPRRNNGFVAWTVLVLALHVEPHPSRCSRSIPHARQATARAVTPDCRLATGPSALGCACCRYSSVSIPDRVVCARHTASVALGLPVSIARMIRRCSAPRRTRKPGATIAHAVKWRKLRSHMSRDIRSRRLLPHLRNISAWKCSFHRCQSVGQFPSATRSRRAP